MTEKAQGSRVCLSSTSQVGNVGVDIAENYREFNYLFNLQTVYDLYGSGICIALLIKYGNGNIGKIKCLEDPGQTYKKCPVAQEIEADG